MPADRDDRLPLPKIHAKDCNCFGGCGCTAAKTDSRCKALRAAILAAIEEARLDGAHNPSLNEALNSGDGVYRP